MLRLWWCGYFWPGKSLIFTVMFFFCNTRSSLMISTFHSVWWWHHLSKQPISDNVSNLLLCVMLKSAYFDHESDSGSFESRFTDEKRTTRWRLALKESCRLSLVGGLTKTHLVSSSHKVLWSMCSAVWSPPSSAKLAGSLHHLGLLEARWWWMSFPLCEVPCIATACQAEWKTD